MKCTKNDSEISTFRDFSLADMSLISMMCSRTLLELSKVLLDSLFIRVLAKGLSELTNCSSKTLIKSLALVHFRIEPQMPLMMWDFINMRLTRLDRSHRSCLAISSVVQESVKAGGSSSRSDKSSSIHPNVKSNFSFYSEKLLPFSIGTISIKAEGITAIIKETKNYFIAMK